MVKTFSVDWNSRIPPFPLGILKKLRESGFESYIAGGAVRDLLLGLQPKDFDIASSATPEEVEALFPKVLAIGRAFGIMRVIGGDGGAKGVEIARFRADGEYKNGRHPESVRFCSAEEDAKRRDFTINALFYDPFSCLVLDYVDGLVDLDRKVIVCVGNPSERFQEDGLRMLRAARFHARFHSSGFTLDSTVVPAVFSLRERISLISRERITQELSSMVATLSPQVGFDDLVKMGLWQTIFGDPNTIQNLTNIKKTFSVYQAEFQLTANFCSFLCLLSQEIGVEKVSRSLLVSKSERGEIDRFLIDAQTLSKRELSSLGKLKLFFSSSTWKLATASAFACGNLNADEFHSFMKKYMALSSRNSLNPPDLITAKDLMGRGYPAGPLLGQILSAVRFAQLDEKIGNQEEALQFVRENFPLFA